MHTGDSSSPDSVRHRTTGRLSAIARRLESPRAWRAALVAGPLFIAMLSVLVGQDANWDLLNYHLHNPWALLEGRIRRDLAPAHLQSYFNPLLDVPYYLLTRWAPPPAVAAAMGAVQGLSFVALAVIARPFVRHSGTPSADALLLAAAGCASAVLLAELGTTMGDATTAPLVLASVALVLGTWPARRTSDARLTGVRLLVAGCVAGAATGLKLTNAPYALAAFLAIAIAWPADLRTRAGVSALFAVGVAAGLATTAGYWFATMWSMFGNPLFPQFNGVFRSPLAGEVNIADTRWLPRGPGEALAFPFILTADPGRAGERPMLQIVLPIVYLLAIASVVRAAVVRRAGNAAPLPAGLEAFLLAWFGLSFLLWMMLFSIHRYLAVLEMLAPIAIWVLARRLAPERAASWVRRLLVLTSVVAIASCNHWGSAGYADEVASVPAPPVAIAPDAVVVVAGAPISWMLPYFPPGPSYLSLGGSFPESPAYVAEAKRRLQAAAGGVSVVFEMLDPGSIESVRRIDRRLERWNPASSGPICGALRWAATKRPKFRAEVTGSDDPGRCRVTPTRESLDAYAARRDDAVRQRLAFLRERYGLEIDPSACRIGGAAWGDRERPYHACPVAGFAR